MTADFIGAFIVGLLGTGHCVGMCGGLGALLSIGNGAYKSTVAIIFYNVGRILSYSLFGALIGGLSTTLSQLSMLNHSLVWLRILSAIMMIILGLYVGRWWFGLLRLEKLGTGIWKYISPLGRKLLPLKKSWHALPFGIIWGWLPCGLVYSALTWAAVSGGTLEGALIMGAFGVGTLPSMLLVGLGATQIKQLQQSPTFRTIAAISIICYGIYTGYSSINMLINLS
ncbi:sulfite exporter TauE/SafE family protein [Vibrio ziniensis]|uniref:Sulfite exporter TauE/SafE family protein n=1 Tax=Vibrio ziniensis TaxID=2711221 RepID=A0A6G7CI75_9VIBR|nr:sulfite exporter TauE/SafE family protein [Vibrio ziniensis]QIH41780.1 sulfite exporter TauE/SafE family protein [Vibrio ziniensis]